MRKYILRRPPDLTSSAAAAESLLAMQNISPIVTAQLNKRYGKDKKHKDMKDGWSPSYMVYKLYLIMVTEIKRRILGTKGRRRWANWTQANTGIQWLLLQLKTNTDCLELKTDAVHQLYAAVECGPDWWHRLSRTPTATECDAITGVLRSLMHGRHRTDLRKDISDKVAFREHMRKLNKMKSVLKSILGVLGGRKHILTLNLDVVKDMAGTVACTPGEVHAMVTRHFREWYANPANNNSTLHTADDWQTPLASLEAFQDSVRHTGVPEWTTVLLYDAITNIPDRDATEAEMAALFAEPPPYSAFCRAISSAKNGSAPGVSGLSYNMIKSWPEQCKQAAYDCLVRQWQDKHICPSWKWRWLVPIPKKFNDIAILKDLRPLMLIETLRKLWTKLIIDRVQRVWRTRHTLNPCQHGCQAQLGTSTASILHIDTIEAAREANQHLHRSSWDKSKAFDSVSKNLMRIAWHRHGVPLEIFQYMVNMDIDGPTVVRTPHAAAAWDDAPYSCVDSPHQPSPTTTVSTINQVLDAFTAERGTGQGDVPSPSSWNAIFDILLTALNRDEVNQDSVRMIRAADQSHYATSETGYVDDLISTALDAAGIQRKADIVSAFCLITGISISMDKLRRVLHDWKKQPSTSEVPDMFIHTYNWEPHAIKGTTEGSTNYLGVAYDANMSGKTAFTTLMDTAKLQCGTVTHTRASDTTKLETVICSTYAKERYTAKLTNLTLKQYRQIDKVFNNFLRTTTKNLHGFPEDLLYLSWKYGGLDIQRFSDATQLDKYQILLSALQAVGPHHHAAEAHLARAARSMQIDMIEGQGVTLQPAHNKRQRRWINSLLEWLAEAGIHLSRHGVRGAALGGDQPIVDYLPEGPELRDARKGLAKHGLTTLSDLSSLDEETWLLPAELEWLRPLLPEFSTAFASPSLRIGQFWQRPRALAKDNLLIHEIASWDTETVLVYKWTHPTPRHTWSYVRDPDPVRLTYDDLFPNSADSASGHTRVSIIKKSATKGTSDFPRTQAAPSAAPVSSDSSPSWKTWVHEQIARQGGYSPAFYTDGSYKEHCSVTSILHPRDTVREAAAAIIIKDTSTSWKNKPVFVVHVADGSDIGTQSAFSMEYIALAMAMTTAEGISTKPVVSDAKAVLDILPGRKAELRNTRKKHSIPLAAMDRLLDGGARLPVHVKAHPEKHKPDRATWTADDWGNFMADRAAAKDWEAFRQAGVQVLHQTVPAGQALEDLLLPGQWYLSDKVGCPISLEGLREVVQKRRFHEYISARDRYRTKRGDVIKWKFNTMQFAAETAGMEKLSVAQRAVVVRRIWDKGWHGGNRCKNPKYPVGTEMHTMAQACDFCGDPDSADHWMHQCQHGPTDAIRQQVLVDINEQVLLQRGTVCGPIALAFQHLLLAGDEPARMWTANFNEEQCAVLQRASKPVLSPDEATAIRLMFKQFTTIINTGAAVMWFTKIQHHGPAEVKTPPTLVVPTTEAMVAMLNPVFKLGIKPPKAARRPRKPTTQQPKATATRLAQVTAPSFIGPVQPPRKLVLPSPDPIALQGLSTALTICAANDVLLDVHNLQVQTRSFCTLLPGVWLDDQIIHAHLALLQIRNPNCMYLDLVLSQKLPPHRPTFDYNEIRHMYRTVPLFDKDLIFMPINISNSHWTLIAMDMVTKTISYYDSMRGNGQLYVNNALAFLRASAEARGVPFCDTEWTCDRHAAEAYPPQPNGFDCGIYAVMVADLLTSRLPTRLLTLETMARARTHVSMCLWEAHAPDLTHCVSYVFAPTPTPAPPVLTQSKLLTPLTATTTPLSDTAQVANVLKSIVDRVAKTTGSPPTLTQSQLFPSSTAPTGPPTNADTISHVPHPPPLSAPPSLRVANDYLRRPSASRPRRPRLPMRSHSELPRLHRPRLSNCPCTSLLLYHLCPHTPHPPRPSLPLPSTRPHMTRPLTPP